MPAQQIATILAAIPLPTLFISTDERIMGANGRARSLLGEAILGRHFITVLRQPVLLDAIEACLRDQAPRTTRYFGSDGAQDTTYVVTCSFVETDIGAGMMLCFEDITHVEQTEQMRRDFVANVSHELRTPLTAVLGFIETLRGPAKNDPVAQDRFLSIMSTEAARMERLVKDLLSLSRVESEERVRPTERINLVDLIASVHHSLGPVADRADVTVALDMPEGPVMLPADPDQLRQVLTNLVENAIKYGGEGKTVTVKLDTAAHDPALRGPGASLTVSDEGPGIDAVHIPRLTERFYRVDSHRSREMGGTGLGLVIVKHIVNRHRGRLRIDSQLGKGTAFRVILPMS